jgi:hypothetical protein
VSDDDRDDIRRERDVFQTKSLYLWRMREESL